MSVADDYGRYFSNPAILRIACYPFRLETVSEADVEQFLRECVAEKLVFPYLNKYIFITKFNQQTRSKSKFPPPPTELVESNTLSKCISIPNHLIAKSVSAPYTYTTTSSTTSPTILNSKTEHNFEKFAARLGAIYGRTGSYTFWPECDQRNFATLLRRPTLDAEITEVERFKPIYEFFPHSLTKLLENWQSVLDAAHNPDLQKRPQTPASKSLKRMENQIDAMIKNHNK
jgi:hypothetical protein